ncbi:hypothetical protein E2C01_044384 [Portunus trituberculatus]|uniref:Uncharacterized protein n=1 Tax=Portunus trituberculatus TaxID=210409 RepID=A0A5B7FYB4_PORTR|nr:hypothetical protein [Portunus trituberculatus]
MFYLGFTKGFIEQVDAVDFDVPLECLWSCEHLVTHRTLPHAAKPTRLAGEELFAAGVTAIHLVSGVCSPVGAEIGWQHLGGSVDHGGRQVDHLKPSRISKGIEVLAVVKYCLTRRNGGRIV